MLPLFRALLVPSLLLPVIPRLAADATDLRGYTTASSKVERDWETRFRAIPEPARQRESMRILSARPHHVGSPYGKQDAEWLRDQMASYGWQATIEEFQVLFPTPKTRLLEMVSPTKFTAKLEEQALKEDPTSGQKSEQLPVYNAYSGDGDVTAPLVYVNYGVPADYDELDRRGISVKGAIVIARYGGSWRGIKPKVAYEHGAVGCLIYSDPKDDGYAQGETYPAGPWRPSDGAQRGSVMDMPTYPGDPLTPGVGATKDAVRLDRKDATTVMKIPVLPISYGDAQPLLAAMTGPVAPESWRGSLPITYRLGAGKAVVHLKLAFDWSLKPIYDVIAKIPGSQYPDEWVVRGNHHDAWVNGAEDPISGAVAELEEARGMGELLKQGWKPKRTIVYGFWDGEEPALLGSTEWAEQHAAELQQKAVMYLNTDGNGRGYLDMSGSHSLERFFNDVAKDIEDPETKLSVWKRRQLATLLAGSAAAKKDARSRGDLHIDALGSGSDFTPFLQHLGIPTLNTGFGGEDGGGIYHSIYDSFAWYTRFSDTSFVYGRALSQTVGTAIMRMADADLLPMEFGDLSETVSGYIGELKETRTKVADKIAETNRQIEDGVFKATDDPRAPLKAPKAEDPAPALNFAPMDNASDQLGRAAQQYEKVYAAAIAGGASAAQLAQANAILKDADQALLGPKGLPSRPWYKHLLYAPGLYTGYGVKTVPGVREAIEQKHWKEADQQISLVAEALEREAALVRKASAALQTAKPIP
ncbi:MAG: M28 family peptidase [Gemmatimonadetes bacterium]|nr:M28 family peptidase [Gemmatimonadota bacterium]